MLRTNKSIYRGIFLILLTLTTSCFAEQYNQYYQEYAQTADQRKGWLNWLHWKINVSPERETKLYALVKKCADKLGVPMPKLQVFKGNPYTKINENLGNDDKCNAYTYHWFITNSRLVIGEDLLKNLSEDELEAVIAHELGHIKHKHVYKSYIAAWTISAAAMACNPAEIFSNIIQTTLPHSLCNAYYTLRTTLFAALDLGLPEEIATQTALIASDMCASLNNTYSTTLNIAIALISYNMLQLFIRRQFENEADATAASIIDDPLALGRGLRKIQHVAESKPTLMNIWDNLNRTHPLTAKRIAHLAEIKKAQETAAKNQPGNPQAPCISNEIAIATPLTSAAAAA